MRLIPTLVLSALAPLCLPLVTAIRPLNHNVPARSLAKLQHHQPRDLIDICLSLDAIVELKVIADILDPGVLDLCLCIKVRRVGISRSL